MTSGYVYILINTSFDGMIKVGRTTRDPQERARELSWATGIPTPFRVAYECLNQAIRRQDLAFIVDGDENGVMFDPNDSIQINAKKFADDMDPWSLLHCCVKILTDDGVKIIQERHNPHKLT
jgi:T5orf172 domain